MHKNNLFMLKLIWNIDIFFKIIKTLMALYNGVLILSNIICCASSSCIKIRKYDTRFLP